MTIVVFNWFVVLLDTSVMFMKVQSGSLLLFIMSYQDFHSPTNFHKDD